MNPAYAGMRNSFCATLIGRQQWAGFDGSPRSAVLSADLILPEDYSSGIGITITTDKLGFENNMNYSFDYSFHRKYGDHIFALGIQAGAYSKHLGPSANQQWVSTSNWMNDQSIPPQIKTTVFDAGAGFWYQDNRTWLGISSSHLNSKLINDGIETVNNVDHTLLYQVARHYFISGGTRIFPYQKWEIRPSFLVKSDATITSFEVNCIALFKQQFWFGCSYRFADAVIPMIGFQTEHFKNTDQGPAEGGMKIGFAYDYTTSQLRNYNSGTFELFLNYCIPVDWKYGWHRDDRFFE